mgnify:CR=1 FL=1
MNITPIRQLYVLEADIDHSIRSALPMDRIIADARFQMESLLPPVPWEIEHPLESVPDGLPLPASSGLDVFA